MTYAMVFPGQGSQYVGMLSDVASQFLEVTNTFEEASSVLGYDLWKITQEGPRELLDQTIHTQPALLAGSYAIWRILRNRHNLKPTLLAGHSLGEYTALVCAESLQFTDAIKLVALRGEYMQEAVAPGLGAMAAIIGLDDKMIVSLCQEISTNDNTVAPANFNSIGQVVVAGHRQAVEELIVRAKAHGAKLTLLLPVSVPSHCSLMQPAADRLSKALAMISIQTPTISVISNVDVSIYDSVEKIRSGLVQQLYSPVRWVETIQACVNRGVRQVIECGPGKVLSGLNKRIEKSLTLTSTTDLASLETLHVA